MVTRANLAVGIIGSTAKAVIWLALVTLALGAFGGYAFAQQPAPAQGQGQDDKVLSKDELNALVGKIALYPDDLVAIVLPASTYPLQVVEAERFLEERQKDPSLKPSDKWDDSIVALLNYPEVVKLMNNDLDWTWKLGDAVINQRGDLLDAIQSFRGQAAAAGNLHTDEHQVVQNDDQGEVAIQPADPQVVYVPYYDPQQVVVQQPTPVYYYYPYAYPLYYYPYPYGYPFAAGYFWGVTTAFVIGWHNHYVHVVHSGYPGHPYYGHTYYGGYYMHHDTVAVSHGNYVWEPHYRAGGQPFTRSDGRQLAIAHHDPNAGGAASGYQRGDGHADYRDDHRDGHDNDGHANNNYGHGDDGHAGNGYGDGHSGDGHANTGHGNDGHPNNGYGDGHGNDGHANNGHGDGHGNDGHANTGHGDDHGNDGHGNTGHGDGRGNDGHPGNSYGNGHSGDGYANNGHGNDGHGTGHGSDLPGASPNARATPGFRDASQSVGPSGMRQIQPIRNDPPTQAAIRNALRDSSPNHTAFTSLSSQAVHSTPPGFGERSATPQHYSYQAPNQSTSFRSAPQVGSPQARNLPQTGSPQMRTMPTQNGPAAMSAPRQGGASYAYRSPSFSPSMPQASMARPSMPPASGGHAYSSHQGGATHGAQGHGGGGGHGR